MPRLRPVSTPIRTYSTKVDTPKKQVKGNPVFGTVKEAGLSLAADVCTALIGGSLALLGKKVFIITVCASTIGGIVGSIEGVRKSALTTKDNFLTNVLCCLPCFAAAPYLAGDLSVGAIGAGVGFAISGFVGTTVHENEKRIKSPLLSKTIEWTAGAAATTAVAGSLSPVVGVAGSIVAGVVAAKATKAVARSICSIFFG